MRRLPSVSILVPTYNRAHTLARTLQSILDQTFRDYEIIVVDDGSTDGTRSLVENSLPGVCFRYVYQANRGVAKARNTGIKASQGEYLAFCDSDDFWLPEKLERQMALFTPDIALVFSDAYVFTEIVSEPKIKFRCFELTTPFRGEVYGRLTRKNFIVASSVVVRKPLLADFVAPFFLSECEDWQMWLAVAKKGLFEYVEQPLAYYYEHSQGLSKQKIDLTASRLKVRKHELALLERDIAADVRLIRALKLLIFKDILLLQVLRTMPCRFVKRLNALYYKSLTVRKAVLKMGIGS